MRHWLPVAIGAILALPLQGRANQQETPVPVPLIEREEVRFVTLDVVVEERFASADGGWRRSRDLRREQFQLLVGGSEIPLDLFENACSPQPSSETREAPAPAAGGPERYVLYFDLEHLNFHGRYAAIQAARKWARDMAGRSDEVMILVAGYGLRIVRPMAPAADHLREDIDAILENPPPNEMWAEGEWARIEEISTSGPTLAQFYADIDYSKTKRSLQNLQNVMTIFDSIEGTKNLLLFADTIRLVPGRQYPAGDLRLSEVAIHLREVATAANERNVRLYPVRAGAEKRADDAFTMLATETGGQYVEGSNRLDVAFDRVKEDASCFYRIGFRTRPRYSGRTETILVRILGKDRIYRARYRRSLDDPTREERVEDIVRASYLDPDSAHGFPISVTATELSRHGDGSRVRVEASLPLKGLLALPAPVSAPSKRQVSVDIGGQVVPLRARDTLDRGSPRHRVWADVEVDRQPFVFGRRAMLTVPTSALGGDARVRVVRTEDFDAPPGLYRVVVVAYDQHAGAAAAALTDFEVSGTPRPLGEIGAAAEDPEAIVIQGEGTQQKEHPHVHRRSKGELAAAPPLLPPRALVIKNQTIGPGRPVHFFYTLCDGRGSSGTIFERWRLNRTISCGSAGVPWSLAPGPIPPPNQGDRCAFLVDTVAADSFDPGACHFEVVLERPGGIRDLRALEIRVAPHE